MIIASCVTVTVGTNNGHQLGMENAYIKAIKHCLNTKQFPKCYQLNSSVMVYKNTTNTFLIDVKGGPSTIELKRQHPLLSPK